MRRHCKDHLTAQQQPLFLRIQREMEITGTFKHRKVRACHSQYLASLSVSVLQVDMVREGFDPNRISDPLFFKDEVCLISCAVVGFIFACLVSCAAVSDDAQVCTSGQSSVRAHCQRANPRLMVARSPAPCCSYLPRWFAVFASQCKLVSPFVIIV